MCGICGFTWDDNVLVKDMLKIISHRGPDQNGIYTDGKVSLGHARLSIIDLTEKGRQPMHNEEGDITLIYNGEIYNHLELRRELEKKGHRFKSGTDTEMVVHAYEEYGEECITMFNGMFAFALWDFRKKKIVLARDRVGIKPLYYYENENGLIFSSEIKAILLHDIKRKINYDAFYNYLTFRYVPDEKTLLEGVSKIPPGHYMVYDLKAKSKQINKYWDLEIKPISKSAKKYSKEVDKEFKESVRKRLMSDVPLGAFLSGGLDSSYLVSVMSKICKEPVNTFSIVFENGKGYDESKFSRMASEIYNTNHQEITLKEDSFKLLPKILWHMDEPIADIALIPTYVLSEFAKKKVSVVLTGEGADEIFGGYRKYKYMSYLRPYFKTMPLFLRKAGSKAFSAFNNSLYSERISEFNNSKTKEDYYLRLISFFSESEKKGIMGKEILDKVKGRPDYKMVEAFIGKNISSSSLMRLDFKTWLPEDLLMKVDKTSMAHGLEARVPFLDQNLIELASKIPENQKIRRRNEKYILRKAMQSSVPKAISKRKKHSFNVPVNLWLDNELKSYSEELLSKKSMENRGLNYNYIEKLFKHRSKSLTFSGRQIWTLMNFEIWARIYLDREDITKKNLELGDII